MKKLLKEFKEFAMRGNVLDMAVGVIIGAAFGKVVNAVIEIFLTPIIDSLPKIEGTNSTGIVGSIVTFLAVVVEFLLTALVLFLIIKAVNKAKSLRKKPEEAPAPAAPAPTCPYCLEEVKEGATRCPHCAGDIKQYKP